MIPVGGFMKRSINTENYVVVLAVALALSLLATACGPGQMKTKLSDVGIKTKPADQKTDSETTSTEINTEDEIIKAVQEDQASTVQTAPIKEGSKESLSKRIRRILVEETAVEGGIQTVLSLSIMDKNNQTYRAEFVSGQYNEVSNSFVFSKPAIVDSRTNKTDLPELSAEIKIASRSLKIIKLTETDKKTKEQTTVTAIVRSSPLEVVSTSSEDKNILDLVKKDFSVKAIQIYQADDNILHSGSSLKLIESNANRVSLQAGNIRFNGYIDISKHNVNLRITNSSADSSKSVISADSYEGNLDAGNTVSVTDNIALRLVNKQTKQESNIILKTASITAAEADSADQNEINEDNANQTTQSQAQNGYEVLSEEDSQADTSNIAAPTNNSSNETKAASPATTSRQQPAKPDFSNVTTNTPNIVKSEAPKPTAVDNAVTIVKGVSTIVASSFTTGFKAASTAVTAPMGSKTQSTIRSLQQSQKKSREAADSAGKAAQANLEILRDAGTKALSTAGNLITAPFKEQPSESGKKATQKPTNVLTRDW